MRLINFAILILLIILLNIFESQTQICDILNLHNVNMTSITSQCRSQLNIVCKNTSLMWQLFDASSKYPLNGLSYSGNKDLGNFDECLSFNQKLDDQKIIGKYCPFSVAVINPLLNSVPSRLLPSTKLKTDYYKQGRNSDSLVTLLSWCVPDACTPREVAEFFLIGDIPNIRFLDKLPCVTAESNSEIKWSDILFLTLLVAILLMIISSTCYEWLMIEKKTEPNKMFIAFSLITNWNKMFTITRNSNEIGCLNGLRFISMMWVIAGHNIRAVEVTPISNYRELRDWDQSVWVQYVVSAPISVDTFFFISGFLMTYNYLKISKSLTIDQQLKQIPKLVLYRYLRLTPAVIVLYFGVITVFRFMGSGPLWQEIIDMLYRPCVEHWWPFFLYTQNYVVYDDMCLNHTWYLSADMQMYVLSFLVLIPISVLLVKRNLRILVLAGIAFLGCISVIIPIAIRLINQIDADHINTYETHTRFIDYLAGMFLGVILREYPHKKYPFTRLQNLIIWIFFLAADLAFNIYYHHVVLNYDLISDTLFFNIYRVIWSSSLAWFVYSCYYGYGGIINSFLSLPVFQVGSRLSYCMYLIHAVVIFYWIGLVRTASYFQDYSIFYVWCGHFIVTFLVSVIWSLAFEAPAVALEKILLRKK